MNDSLPGLMEGGITILIHQKITPFSTADTIRSGLCSKVHRPRLLLSAGIVYIWLG